MLIANVCPGLQIAHSFGQGAGSRVPSDALPLAGVWMHPDLAVAPVNVFPGSNLSMFPGNASARDQLRFELCAHGRVLRDWAASTRAIQGAKPAENGTFSASDLLTAASGSSSDSESDTIIRGHMMREGAQAAFGSVIGAQIVASI